MGTRKSQSAPRIQLSASLANQRLGWHNRRPIDGSSVHTLQSYAESYENFLRNQLEAMLEDLPVATYATMIFQHDGAPAHFSRRCREYLNRRFPMQWIGRGGPIAWPARSPDLTPVDFFYGVS